MLRSILTFYKEYDVQIDELLLLQNDNFDELQVAELAIFEKTNRAIFEENRIRFED